MRRDKGNTTAKIRILVVFSCLTVGFAIVLLRLFFLHILHSPELTKKAERQRQRTVAIEGERGTIYDRRGRILAINKDVPSIYAIPSVIEEPRKAAGMLSRVLKVSEKRLSGKLAEEKNFVWIKRQALEDEADVLQQSAIDGVGILMESKRFYPRSSLAGHLLGFTGLDNQGLEGIERRYDRHLSGEKDWILLEKDALGKTVFPKGLNYSRPPGGKDLVLTIDEVIQYIGERELAKAVAETKALGGEVIVMNPKTGEVLAMAVWPRFDPNVSEVSSPSAWRNRAVTDPYEPGSTLKLVVASGALEEGINDPEDIIYCEEGHVEIDGEVFRDPFKHGYLSFAQVIQKSSNIGVIKVGLRLGEERLYRYLKAFGFGEKTEIDLNGESPGLLKSPSSWSRRSLASISIGQEIAVTPLQLITAVSAIANGGWLMRPYVVREVRQDGGQVVVSFSPEVRRRAVSYSVSQKMAKILEGVTMPGGTGEKAAVAGYSIAGKTGTAQKVEPGTKRYSKDHFIASFVGYVPSEDPQVAILVVIDQPQGDAWGGSIAAPVFKQIAWQVLNYLAIPPKDMTRVLVATR